MVALSVDPEQLLKQDGETIINLAGKEEQAAEAIVKQWQMLAKMKGLIQVQRTLLEAANSSPYGWMAARHMEDEQGVFTLDDKDNTKALREAEGCVRRDN